MRLITKQHFYIKKGWCAMDKKLHVAGWGWGSPTPAQLKELFAQIESGAMTSEKLQKALRNNEAYVDFQNIPFGMSWKEKGWKSEKDSVIKKGDFFLELISFCEDGKSISGKELERMAIEQGCCELGLAHAEQLLKQQDRIPKSWRKHYLVFAGSVWRDAGGARDVPFLDWDGDRWYLCFSWLRSDFGSYGRFVRPCK